MPRKDFRKHLEQASTKILPTNISQLREGEDDGTLIFVFKAPKLNQGISIQASISDIGDYPRAHNFFVFATSDNVPEEISEAIAAIGPVDSLTIDNLIKFVANKLNTTKLAASKPSGDDDLEMLDATDDEDWEQLQEPPEDDDDFYDEGFLDDDDDDDDDDFNNPASKSGDQAGSLSTAVQIDMPDSELEAFRARVCADMHQVKRAGLRFAYQGSLLQPGGSSYAMISCRVAKLGIPEDALKAWYLSRDEYIMLIIHYPSGYKTLEQLTTGRKSDRSLVSMHVAVTKRHKLSLSEAIGVFTLVEKRKEGVQAPQTTEEVSKKPIRPLFIGTALNDLLNTRLTTLIQYRQGMNFSWAGAELFYNDNQGRSIEKATAIDVKYYEQADHGPSPSLTKADHMQDRRTNLSFPLVATQFLLRHLVHCTVFCLVCWCKTGDEFDALKPYVCSKPLCLYQYMTLGFGPSIEFEILTQPYVVDLLVSFCYAGTMTGGLKHFPVGLGIVTPNPSLLGPVIGSASSYVDYNPLPPVKSSKSSTTPSDTNEKKSASRTVNATWNEQNAEFRFSDYLAKSIKAGQWICFWGKDGLKRHCRITEMWYPVLRHGPVIQEATHNTDLSAQAGSQDSIYPHLINPAQVPKPAPTPPYPGEKSSKDALPEVSIAIYDTQFDELEDGHKQSALRILLDSLPSILDMREYLQNKNKQGFLHTWTDRILPSALSVLRWIIASNRSCIVQPDSLSEYSKSDEEQVYGMDGYQQFRFASGAPDKESRFIKCVRETKARLNQPHPTIFAWHGSPLPNWHSIVREGLKFDKISHGRAYGHGVYHSLQSQVSLGYSGGHAYYGAGGKGWPSSRLNVGSALSLNEIVNAPAEFVSKSPHLVVNQIDWIQTRYLFVKCNGVQTVPAAKPTQVLEQDPIMRPQGDTNSHLVIPMTAISKSRRPTTKPVKSGAEGSKKSRVSVDPAMVIDLVSDDELSEVSDEEDLKIVSSNSRSKKPAQGGFFTAIGKGLSMKSLNKRLPEEPKTPFTPGSLNRNTLPMLAPPIYATPQATKALQREIKTLIKAQASNSLEELGWYFDPETVENPYQLIVEMHSFDLKLPLAQDMMAQKVGSIVFELRFGQTFPFSPPFIRVIRPRFLTFQSGGGGHVTAGGAICMELLTNSGWNPSTVLEAVLLQVRMAITSTDPKPARLEKHGQNDYGVGEAVDAYRRACMTHGWQIPQDFYAMTTMSLTNDAQAGPSSLTNLPPLAPAPTSSGRSNFNFPPIAPAPPSFGSKGNRFG